MNKNNFTPDIWLSFYFNEVFHIGRTILEDNIPMVSCVSEIGEIKIIPYSKTENRKQLKLLKDMPISKPKTTKRDIDFYTNTN